MGRLGRGLVVAVAYALIALLFVAPWASRWTREIPSQRGGFDAPFQAFVLGWNLQALSNGAGRLFDVPIFHPEKRTLTYMDHLVGEALLAWPVAAVTGSTAAGYNFVFALSYFLSAWVAYRLARVVGLPRPAAFLSGLLFAYGSYRLTNIDFLNQLQTQFIPLGLYLGIRYLQTRAFRHAIGVAGAVVAQVYCGWYYTYVLILAVGLLAFVGWTTGHPIQPPSRRWRWVLLGTAAIVVVAPVVYPYLAQRAEMPAIRRTLGQTALYSADLLDYARSSDLSLSASRTPLPVGVNAYFPGILALALGILGLFRIRERGLSSLAVYFPTLAISGFVLSLGPILQVASTRILVPLPYAVLYFVVPGMSALRAPARFAVLVALAWAILAGIGAAYLGRILAERRRGVAPALTVAIALLALAETWPRSFRTVELPTAAAMPAAYRWLRDRDPEGPLLELPSPARDEDETEQEALRQYGVLLHGHPRLDGCSGFVSPRYRAFRRDIQGFPDSAALELATRMDARWILVHFGDYTTARSESLRSEIDGVAGLTEMAAFGSDAIYRLRPRDP